VQFSITARFVHSADKDIFNLRKTNIMEFMEQYVIYLSRYKD
jgi:hypothetical protein